MTKKKKKESTLRVDFTKGRKDLFISIVQKQRNEEIIHPTFHNIKYSYIT